MPPALQSTGDMTHSLHDMVLFSEQGSVVQCVAVCCSVLQCVDMVLFSEQGSVLQCVAVCCSVLQCVDMVLFSEQGS